MSQESNNQTSWAALLGPKQSAAAAVIVAVLSLLAPQIGIHASKSDVSAVDAKLEEMRETLSKTRYELGFAQGRQHVLDTHICQKR